MLDKRNNFGRNYYGKKLADGNSLKPPAKTLSQIATKLLVCWLSEKDYRL
ncbi:MAG: hypothetical protein LBH59_05760 [Planctomycetaceae bacterium]|nr:hypothetical protein [Planctomycetaceae bacterium]